MDNQQMIQEVLHIDTVETPATPDMPQGVYATCEVRLVSSADEFDGLEKEWNALIDRSPARIYQTFEWLREWWRHNARTTDRLYILLFSTGATLVGIAPLTIREQPRFGLPAYRRLQFIGVGLNDYADFIVDPAYEIAVYAAFIHHLVENRREWDLLDLEDVTEDSALVTRFPAAVMAAGLSLYTYQGSVCPWFTLPATADGVLSHLGSASASNFRRKQKKFYSQFQGEMKFFSRETDDIAQAVEDFAVVHGKRWNSLGFPSAFDDPGLREFHVSFSRAFARRGWLRIYLLYANGEPVAASYGFNYRGRIYMYHTNAHGSPEVMRCSPGLIVRTTVISDGINEGMTVFDYLRGDEEYKYREWPVTESKNFLLRIVSPRMASRSRFLFFLLEEFWLKGCVRIQREYYGYRRYLVTKNPSILGRIGFVAGRLVELVGLVYDFVYRHSPLRTVRWLSLRKQGTTSERQQQEPPEQADEK